LNRYGSIPLSHPEKTKVMSFSVRALTKYPQWGSHLRSRIRSGFLSSIRIKAIPLSSVEPCHTDAPSEECTATRAPATGLPEEREVTQTTDDSRPHLKWAARSVTSAAAGTNIGLSAPRSDVPRIRLSISKM
jgi:hypothetical protein